MYDTPETAWIRALRAIKEQDNLPSRDLTEALHYRLKCIKDFDFDPLPPPFPLHNRNPRHYFGAHQIAKLEWIIRNNKKVYDQAVVKKKLKIVGAKNGGTRAV